MSDFSAILDLLASVVTFVIKWTVNLICACVYLVSVVLPWRMWEEFANRRNVDDWRCNAFLSLFLTIFDVIAIPLGIISLSSVLRWPHIAKAFKDYSKTEPWLPLFPLSPPPQFFLLLLGRSDSNSFTHFSLY
jgi:hypothetical protein